MKEVTVTLTEEEAKLAFVAISCWSAHTSTHKHPFWNNDRLEVLDSAKTKLTKFQDEDIQRSIIEAYTIRKQ